MKKSIAIASAILIIFMAACAKNEQAACTMDAKICPDGSGVGRIPPDCEFAPCPESNETKCDYINDEPKYMSMGMEECSRIRFQCELSREPFFDECGCGCKLRENINQSLRENAGQSNQTKLKATDCVPEQRNADFCAEIYKPVCGWFDPDKIACVRYPCARTFSNGCFACMDEMIISWTEGECPGS